MRSIRLRTISLSLALIAGGLMASAAIAARLVDPVALLVQAAGDIQVQRSGETGEKAATVGMQLNPGDQVLVREGGRVVLLYRTGRMQKSAESVTIMEPKERGNPSLFSKTVQTLGQVATTDARTQPNRQGMIRPIAGAPAPIAPRNDIKVMGVRPTFTWYGVSGVEGYMVQIRRVSPDASPPQRYQAGADTSWVLPGTEAPLVPGATYEWTVGGIGGGRVAPPQRFTVLGGSELMAVEASLRDLITAGIDPSSEGLFLAALTYRDAGLFYEAQRALRQIEDQGATLGFAYYTLLGEVLDALGSVDEAQEAFRRAEAAAP